MTTSNLEPGWRWVRLEEVASHFSKSVPEPATSEYQRFVSSEHVGRFDWTVSSWGDSANVASSKKAFEAGDYLFVARSLYGSDFRERAARADFRGVCSNGILALRELPDVLVDGFLGVVLNHPRIWEFVVRNATGTLTRYVYWKTLKEYGFPLPPKREQERIIEAVGAAARFVERSRAAQKAAEQVYGASLATLFTRRSASGSIEPDGWAPRGWPLAVLGELVQSDAPISYGIVQVGDPVPGGVPTATSSSLNFGLKTGI